MKEKIRYDCIITSCLSYHVLICLMQLYTYDVCATLHINATHVDVTLSAYAYNTMPDSMGSPQYAKRNIKRPYQR